MLFPRRLRWLTLATGCTVSVAAPLTWSQDAAPPAARVASPLAVEPKTPDELFKAVLFTLQIGRPEVAKQYLDAFVATSPDDDVLLKLRNEYGTATFMELADNKDLQPTSHDLIARLRQAALNRINDTAVVDSLIDKLSGAPREREPALQELRHLRGGAVPHLIRRVTARQSAIPADLAVQTLVAIGDDAVAPLIAAMQSGPEVVRGLAADALGRIGGPAAELALWHPAFADSSPEALKQTAKHSLARILHGDPQRTDLVDSFGAARKLERRSEQLLHRDAELPVGDDGKVAVWTWDAAQSALVEERVSPEAASLYLAELAAREAVDLAGDASSPQVLLMTILLARDVEQNGWDKPVPEGPGTAHDLALEAGPELAEAVLKTALAQNRPAAALAALRVLEQNGSRKQLAMVKGKPSPVVAALDSPDPRVQFAAAETILQWDPETPFPQARRVVEILARALTGTERPASVVIDPNADRATNIGDFLGSLGYEPRVARTGQSGFETAAARGDVALAAIHLNAIRWELSQTIANLRADSRTASIPIAIYGPADLKDRVRHLQSQYQRVAYIEDPNNAAEVSRQILPFLAQITPPNLTAAQREAQRESAAYWLRHLATSQRTKIFDLGPAESALADAVNDPKVGRYAIVALGAIPTATAQERLLNTAVNDAITPDLRAVAARQLGFHIQRHGLLVSEAALGMLRTAAEAETDPAARSALAAVAGSLKPDARLIREKLLAYPPSTSPVKPAAESDAAVEPAATN